MWYVMVIREVEVRGRERLDVFVPKGVYGTVERSGSTNQSRWCLFFVVILARIGPKELNGLILHQALKHSLRLRRGEVKILEGVSSFEMGLNIEDTTFCKSASLVDPYVQEPNTWRWSM